ncbi:MAG: sigma-70 family RNA polymerase sigma factor [Bacteroidetes bacterium]|nr:MAG: sigma-70 family RNA polymerase sigma factor [Bacteroidota bacterium]
MCATNWIPAIPQAYTQLSDQELVAHYQTAEDTLAIAMLIKRYEDMIRAIAHRFHQDTEALRDLMQDLFVVLRDKLRDIQIDRSFRAWFGALLRNRFIDQYRRQQVRSQFRQEQQREPPESSMNVESGLDFRTLRQHMQLLLSERECQCLELHFLHDLSYEDIAEQEGWTFKQVCGCMYRGMKKLRHGLPQEYRQVLAC